MPGPVDQALLISGAVCAGVHRVSMCFRIEIRYSQALTAIKTMGGDLPCKM
jgi:uncharacterized Fe-S cluster-containing radical SAM superfamily protein